MDNSEDVGVELKNPLAEGGVGDFMATLQMVQDHWLGSFLLNILGYALIVVPAALLIRRWKGDPAVRAG